MDEFNTLPAGAQRLALVLCVTQPGFFNLFCSNTWKHKGRGSSEKDAVPLIFSLTINGGTYFFSFLLHL